MEKFTANLYARMQAELEDISQTIQGPLNVAEQSFQIVCAHLRELKGFTLKYEFKDIAEEIRFFKEVKPLFLKEVIYFMRLFEIESARPVGGVEMQKAYYERLLEEAHAYFEQNRFLYMYYQTNKSYLDGSMFVRNPQEFPLYPHYSLDDDPEFSNVYSFRMAKIQAFEEIIIYLESLIYSTYPADTGLSSKDQKSKSPLSFTGTKAQFIELSYSLQCAGIFNNGKADVKQVMATLQSCFNIKVSNYYGYFQSMRIRKKNRTPFIDLLKDVILRRMDDSDEHPQFS